MPVSWVLACLMGSHGICILYVSDGQVPKPVTNRLSTPREEEALIYLGIGATVAFLLSAGTLVRKII